jgi:hypothetical protein
MKWGENGVWFDKGHIDDMLFIDTDPQLLERATVKAANKMECIKWYLNREKSVLKPVKDIEFLVSYEDGWSFDSIL